MTLSLLRKSALALVAFAGIAATPAFAGGFSVDTEVIYADQDYSPVPPRPMPPQFVEPQWQSDVDFLSPRQVSRLLRHQGYGQVTDISMRGDQYRVIAIRNNGALVQLLVDAETGDVLSARRVGWAPRHERPARPGVSIEFGWDSNR